MRDLEELRPRPAPAQPRRRKSPEELWSSSSSWSMPSGGTGPSSSSWWESGDAEAKRQQRVAAYKAYAAEGRLKASLRRGLRWVKIRCSSLASRCRW